MAGRERLEYDWSDKKDAFEIETVNCRLNNKSTTSLLRPGATRFLDELRTINLVVSVIFNQEILNKTFFLSFQPILAGILGTFHQTCFG